MRSVLVLSVLALASAASAADATGPGLVINHSGRILDADDKPATGPVDLKVALHTFFTSGPGDQTVWSDDFKNVPLDASGSYTVSLGDTTVDGGTHVALTPDLFTGDRWMSVSVNDVPLAPWLRLGMMPTAAQALDSTKFAGLTLTALDARYDQKYAALAGATGYAQLSPTTPQTGNLAVTGSVGASAIQSGAITSTGTVAAQAFVGDGSGLTALDAANLKTGTLSDDRLPADVVVLSSSPSFSGAVSAQSFSGKFAGDGLSVTALSASAISTGTVADARLSSNVVLLSSSPTFGAVTATSFAGDGSKLTNLTATALPAASASAAGYLKQTDWSTFNNKIGTITAGTGIVVGGTASSPTVGLDPAGRSLQLADNTASPSATLAGTLRWHLGRVEVCDGVAWVPVYRQTGKFTFTGGDQSWLVPPGVTSINVKLWGAGGGGGGAGGWNYGFPGGAGGYTSATMAVTPGTTLTVMVGLGGAYGFPNGTGPNYGGAGPANSTSDDRYGSPGGGRSAIRLANADLVTAGGGGGGGSSRVNTGSNAGGAGGGATGAAGGLIASAGTDSAAGGGGQASGGNGGNSTYSCASFGSAGKPGAQYIGGQPGCNAYGGSGGGGWYGGGGGAYDEGNTMGGGGGGSSYVGGAGVSNGVMVQGSGTTPPSTTDGDYLNGVGLGGAAGVGQNNPGGTGGNGLVVISY